MYGDFPLEEWLHLSDETTVQILSQAVQPMHVKKGGTIVEVGEVQTQIPILVNGIFRGFVLDSDGREVTDCFGYRKGELVIGSNPLGEPSRINLEAMTDCEMAAIPLSAVLPQLDSCMDLLKFYNRYLLDALGRHWKVKMLMYQYTAMQRYLWFLENYPGLIDAVNSKHIASFLGMTPVTISRLRRQLRGGKKMGRGKMAANE